MFIEGKNMILKYIINVIFNNKMELLSYYDKIDIINNLIGY